MSKISGYKSEVSVKKDAFNCVEHLLLTEEITVDKYEILRAVIGMFSDNSIPLGDGVFIKLVDEVA